jgi:hypothetical protein
MASDPGYTVTQYSINASSGAFTTILGTRLSRRAEIIEDASQNAGTQQGLIFQRPSYGDSSVPGQPTVTWGPTEQITGTEEPLVLGNPASDDRQFGNILCNGPGFLMQVGATPALPLINIKSAGSATKINVKEYS